MNIPLSKLQCLPEFINMAGIAMTKIVFIEEVRLSVPTEAGVDLLPEFMWGFGLRGPHEQNAFAIALATKYLGATYAPLIYEELSNYIIGFIKQGNFKCSFKLREVFMRLAGHYNGPEATADSFFIYEDVEQPKIPAFGGTGRLPVPGFVMPAEQPSELTPKVKIIHKEDGSYDVEN